MEYSTSIAVFFIATVVASCLAQIPFLGACPHMSVVQDFNVTRYLGKWYEQERYFAIFQLGGSCVTATYTLDVDGSVEVNNEMTILATKRKSSIKGKAKLGSQNGEAKLEVRFPSVGNFAAPYWILDTDYDNYAIVWSCSGIFGANAQFAWVLTREKKPGLEVVAKIKQSIEEHKPTYITIH